MLNNLKMIGIGRNAPLYILEKFDFDEKEIIELLKSKVDEIAVLKTCHRREIYFIGDLKKLPFDLDENVEGYLIQRTGLDVVRHLFKVSSGLDSMVLGEHQILSQVKNTYKNFCEGKLLKRIFNEAISVGKEVREKTGVSKFPLSISYIAVKLIEELKGKISEKDIFVIGTGQMGQKVVKYLVDRNANVYISNRTKSKALEIKNKYPGVHLVDFSKKYEFISKSDVVISATNAPHYVVEKKKVNTRKKILFIDLSMPRNIDPKLSKLHDLYTLDDLQKISEKYSLLRKEKIDMMQKILEQRIEKFLNWYYSRNLKEKIEDVIKMRDIVVEEEFKRLVNKVEDNKNLEKIKESLRRCANRMASYHIQYLKGERL
ncbi:glutamyl-tRNA reductase [Thermosipho africanus Ob7]|uniref:glutamyl-tRNA reductase n=1 Tax=Thermosipho africanus TaxID=2421 RepID=UPI000E0BFDC8|nr:glutamyl-tRNA reductase [Thermosipho africanus]RDI90523.1 glutamyl-tRNA reductase [Thermosipho africanus Ob7]